MFLGDNGTLGSITSRFQGADYRGGKGSTNRRGTHVPLIVNWPAVIRQGRVNGDLVSSVDLLPTICAAAGAEIPANIDGVSFLPQLKGEAGQPREWLYSWYSPRQQANLTVKEFAFNHHYKLYRTGEFFDLAADPFEERALSRSDLTGSAADAAARLQRVLDQFANARPAELDRAFLESTTAPPSAKQGKNKNKNQQKNTN
jgi:arylsulfatase A